VRRQGPKEAYLNLDEYSREFAKSLACDIRYRKEKIMARSRPHVSIWLIAVFLVSVAWTLGFGAEKTPFYQGKTLTIVINFAAGGPTDIESRIFAKHLGKHIPGQPAIVVQNMGGGGGLTAVNYIGEVAKPDGLTAAYFTGSLFQHQIKDPALRVDIGTFGFITGVQGVTVSYIRSDVPPGIKKPSDFVKAERFRAAGLGVSSSKDVRFRLSFDLLGLKYDYVTGYNSSSTARLAVQRNEAQYHDETLPSYRAAVEPQMVQTGVVTALYYTDLVTPSGEILVSRDVPELQPFTHYYREIFGKPPSGIKYEALKAANMSSTNMTRMVLMPPKAPPETITILRQAFDSLSRDQDFLEDAVKTMRFQPRFEVGQAGEALFKRASQTSPEIINFLRQYIEEANK
jgi:tripartite-type tricarboxylate transporter receptor subunit TctC